MATQTPNFIGIFFSIFFRSLLTAIFAPYRLLVGLYATFNHGQRFLWLEWVYMGLTGFTIGYSLHNWHTDSLFSGIGTYLMLSFTLLLVVDVLTQLVIALPDDGLVGEVLGFLKWSPRGSTGTGGVSNFQAFPVTSKGKDFVRGAAVLDGAEYAAAQAKSGEDLTLNLKIGGVAVPYQNEAEHFLISGKTGAGKTQAINEILRTVRRREQPAIIADPAGGYVQKFFVEGVDFILNPFDSRSSDWSPFLELEHAADAGMIAKAAIPDTSGSGKEWNNYAQTLFREILLYLWRSNNHSVKELLRLATAAPPKELHKLLSGTAAAAFTAPDNERMLGSVRSVLASHIAAWEYLPDKGNFSVRQWVRDVGNGQSSAWLYLTYMDNQLAMLRSLVSCWLELAIVEGLSLGEQPERRIFYVMDELDSLGKVNSLRAGLTKLRKYGGVCINGLQTIAQLRDTYGREEAQTLLSCMSTKLLLAAGDAETAEYFSREIGDMEFSRKNKSKGRSGRFGDIANTSQTTSTEHRTERAVMASEITALPNLHGFLKPVGLPVMRIVLEYVGMPDVQAAFIRNTD